MTAAMRVFFYVLLVCAVDSALVSQTSLSVFVTEDAPVPNPAELLTKPVFLVAKSSTYPGYYKAAVIVSGLGGEDVRSDSRYKEVQDLLHSSGDKYALLTDISKFYNSQLFNSRLREGDQIIVPRQFKVENYSVKSLPVLVITDQADFESFDIKNLKLVCKFEIYSDGIKLIH